MGPRGVFRKCAQQSKVMISYDLKSFKSWNFHLKNLFLNSNLNYYTIWEVVGSNLDGKKWNLFEWSNILTIVFSHNRQIKYFWRNSNPQGCDFFIFSNGLFTMHVESVSAADSTCSIAICCFFLLPQQIWLYDYTKWVIAVKPLNRMFAIFNHIFRRTGNVKGPFR